MTDGITNIDKVKSVLSKVNSRFTTSDVVSLTGLTKAQVSKALRSIGYVKSDSKGNYVVGGRKTG